MIDQPTRVEVFFPEHPFGGVQVEFPNRLEQIAIGQGGAVTSVFGRIGAVTAECGDYAACYAPLGSGLPDGGTNGQVLTKQGDAPFDATWEDPTGGGNIAVTGNILMGDGAGNAVAAPFDAGQVVTKNEAYATPLNLNQVIACLQANGLCA